MLQGESMPIGFSKKKTYKQSSVNFGLGDLFFFYSDGVTEARNQFNEFFGESRLSDIIRENSRLSCEKLLQIIKSKIVEFTHSDTFIDDLTCVAIRTEKAESQTPILKDKRIFTSDLGELTNVRKFIREFAGNAPSLIVDDEFINMNVLAVNEAVSNIIRHAYKGRPGEKIVIEASFYETKVIIRIYHEGETFNPDTVPTPTFDGSRNNGFGLYIIAHWADEVNYSKDEKGTNCIQIVKHYERGKQNEIQR
jgi:anti-sigma regulatory factor (Ser/Thr protein kinase)